IWVNSRRRVIPTRLSIDASRWDLGSTVNVKLSARENEVLQVTDRRVCSTASLHGGVLKMLVRAIFPPSSLGVLKLYSHAVGLISVDESLWSVFDQARAAVYETTTEWCPDSREFELVAGTQMRQLEDAHPHPTYLYMLKASPWARLIVPPEGAEDAFKIVLEDMEDSDGSTSSSDEDVHREVLPSDFVRNGIVFKKCSSTNQWDVLVLDCEEKRNQWTKIGEHSLARKSPKPFLGAMIEIHLNPTTMCTVDEWSVVQADPSVVPVQSYPTMLLDVAAKAERIVNVGERKVIRLHNKRLLDIYDYEDMLGSTRMGTVVRVIVKWTEIPERERAYRRSEWVVCGFGDGEPVLPQSRRRRNEFERALREFRFVNYAGGRDWQDNRVLKKYKMMVRESQEEEARREEDRRKKWERERRSQEEEEVLRRKEMASEDEEEENGRRREEQEHLRQKRASLAERREEEGECEEEEEQLRHKLASLDEEDSDLETASSVSQITVVRRDLPSSVQNNNDSDSNSTHSSIKSQQTVIRRKKTQLGPNVNDTRDSISTQSSIRTQTTVVEVRRQKDHSADSGKGSSSRTGSSTASDRELRALAVMRRMEVLAAKNAFLRAMLQREDGDLMDDLSFVLDEYTD
ncbi:hypothetical protein PMAYCL1PPCAC_31540, partial [Pristionchus mayeri]